MSMQGAQIGNAPKQSDLANIRDQLHNLISHMDTTNSNIGSFLDRVNGPTPQPANETSKGLSAVPSGVLGEIQGALGALHSKIAAARDMSSALSGIA